MVYHEETNVCCAAKAALPCEVDGKVHKDGEEFKLNCSLLCSCQNGQYACSTLCPQEMRAPSTYHCRDPQVGDVSVSVSAISVRPSSSLNLPVLALSVRKGALWILVLSLRPISSLIPPVLALPARPINSLNPPILALAVWPRSSVNLTLSLNNTPTMFCSQVNLG